MPIPSLRADSMLPAGTHQATLTEVLSAYPATNEQRQILNEALLCAIPALQQLAPSPLLFVDGSYVTRKAEPNDVDLLIISSHWGAFDLVSYLDQVCPVKAVSLDINVEPRIPNGIVTLFTKTRRGQPKGIIQIVP